MTQAQNKLYITANGETRTATLADNAATAALRDLLTDGAVMVSMRDYGGFEKVGDLPQSLPASNAQLTASNAQLPASNSQLTAQPGDIMLYQGYQMVVFYGNNSWSYTRLGRIDGATASDIKSWLGTGRVDLELSLSSASGVQEIGVDRTADDRVYDLTGRMVTERPLRPGIYIVNGKKTAVR